ncbi:MAG: tetratricopeptide repeat protein [Bacteroidales bacterium]|jgi:antitoxin component YwqK of YwqJK toxin-antitoxin module/Tfp pilus assembly protein PilF|nr:tetratricopeptide repeat protein [Bacteroidales bacterium]
MRKFILLFLSVAVYCMSLTVGAQEQVSETLIREGVKLYDEGKYNDAISLYRQVDENDSNYVWMLTELSMTFLQTQDYDSAIYYADKGLQFPSPQRQSLMRNKGTAYLAAGNADKSIEVYKEAIRLYPYSYLLHYNQGVTYVESNDFRSAMKSFQEAIRCNPFHASSHMRLGILMARQEQYTRALLSLETFLALEPQSERSNAILVFIENLSSGHLDTTYGDFIEPVADNNPFEELDELIKSRIALNDKYTPAIKFNANIVKQTTLMMEMLTSDAETDDFWAETYWPLFHAIKDGGHIEPFLYTILSSSGKEDVSKWLGKNKKAVEAFYQTGKYLNNIRNSRQVTIDGKDLTLATTYNDNGNLNSLGNSDPSGAEQGFWQYFHPNGELKAEGRFIVGKKDGEWKYRTAAGIMESVENYDNGVLNGEYISYHPTGKPNVTGTFINGMVDGKVTWHNIFGITSRSLIYRSDTLDGEARTYYSSSQPMEVYSNHKDQITGKHITYYAAGQEGIVALYNSGSPNGEYLEYHPNGRLSVKGTYINGKEEGEWTYWYSNGRVKLVRNYNNGVITGMVRVYHMNGEPESEINYNSSGKQDGLTTTYDYLGRKVLEEQYRDGLIVKMTSGFNNPDKLAVYGSEDGTFSYRVYTYDGRLRSEGSYDKGIQTGEVKFYYNNGNLRQKFNLKNGEYDGEALTFHPNGKTESASYYRDGLLEGKYVEYGLDGTILKTGSYLGNSMNNYWYYNTADGSIETSVYYINGLINGWYTSYSVDGKIKSRDMLTDGRIVRELQFDPEGNLINDIDFLETTAYQTKSRPDIVIADAVMKGGFHDGPMTWYYPDGKPSTKMNFIADNQNGEYLQYYPDGKPMVKGRLENGNKEGLWITWGEEGNIDSEQFYFNNMMDSVHSYYYDDGSVRLTETYFNDKLEGEYNQYAPGGELMISLIYSGGELIGYRYMKGGKLTDIITITKGDQPVIAWYDNGQKSYEQHFRDFVAEGEQVKYYPDGKVMQRRQFSNDMLNGKCEKFYPDGSPETLYFCRNSLYEGEYINYYRSGKVQERLQFLHDQRHGNRYLFDAEGNPLPGEQYWSGSFIGFIK